MISNVETDRQLFERLSENEVLISNTFCIDGQITKSKKICVKTINELVLELSNARKKMFYEEVFYPSGKSKRKLRFYMDVEWYSESEESDSDYMKYILLALDNNGIYYSIASASSYRSDKQTFKNSYHIIANNFIFDDMISMKNYILHGLSKDIYHLYEQDHEGLGQIFIDALLEKNRIIDQAVYVNGQRKFRLPNTYKMMVKDGKGVHNEETYLNIIKGDIKDFIISAAATIGDPLILDEHEQEIYNRFAESKKVGSNHSKDFKIKIYSESESQIMLSRLREVIKYLPEKLAYETNSWRSVLKAIATVSIQCNTSLIDEAREFSSKSRNYNKTATDSNYKFYVDNRVLSGGIGYLINQAKKFGYKTKVDRITIDEYKSEYDDITTFLNDIKGKTMNPNKVLCQLGKLLCVNIVNGICVIAENGEMKIKSGGVKAVLAPYNFYGDEKKPVIICKKTGETEDRSESFSVMNDIYFKNIELFNIKSIIFDPRLELGLKDGIYNIYKGFKAKKSNDQIEQIEQIIKPVLYHLREVWCSGCEISFEFLINWLASIVQRPWEKTGVCIVLKSKTQGTGKNIMTDFLRDHLFGAELSGEVSDMDRLMARFNSSNENRLLTVLDEASNVNGDDYNKYADMLKNKITSNTQTIEMKGREPRVVADYNNYIITTNNVSPIRSEETCRRFFWLEASTKHKGQVLEYFKPLKDALNQTTADAFYTWLLVQKTKYMPIPETQFRMSARINGLRPVQRWLLTLNIEDVKISFCNFYKMYADYCRENNMKVDSSIWFGRNLPEEYFNRTRDSRATSINFTKNAVSAYMRSIGIDITKL